MQGSGRGVEPPGGESEVVRRLDELVAAAHARCGLLVVRSAAGLSEVAARSDRRRDLVQPIRYSRPVCERAFADGRTVDLIDAGGVASRRSFVVDGPCLDQLVHIECTPIHRREEVVAVVYLETGADRPPPGKSPQVQAAVRALAEAAFPADRT
jgi:hypothetical protein